MTGEAFFRGIEPSVLHLRRGYPLLFIFMTSETEIAGSLSSQIKLVIARVRAMTPDAVILHGLVNKLLLLKGICLVSMASKAYIVACGNQHLGEIALVGTVTDRAAADRNRSVHILSFYQGIIMT